MRGYNATADVIDDAVGYARKKAQQYGVRLGGALDAASLILEDPAMPQVASMVVELNRLEPARPGATRAVGIGLHRVVTPLKFYVATRRNPTLGWVALGAVIGVPFLIGYLAGGGGK